MDIPDGSSYASLIGLHPRQQNEQQGKEQSDPAIPRETFWTLQFVKYLSFNVYSQLLHTSLAYVWAAYSLPKCPPQIKAGTLPLELHSLADSSHCFILPVAVLEETWFASIQISAWQHSSNTSSMNKSILERERK